MTTIKDIAKASGVSSATVSYVLNKRPGTVSAETSARVLSVMRELNYRPSPLFRRKQASRTNTIGILQNHWGSNTLVKHPYYAYILDGVLSMTTALGWNLTMFTNSQWDDVPRSLRSYLDGRCDGLILVAPPEQFPLISGLLERGLPFIIVNGGMVDDNLSSVDVDNVAGGFAATEHLIGLGHNKIAMLPGDAKFRDSNERAEGYRDALAAHRIVVPKEYSIPGNYFPESGYERGRVLLSMPVADRPTAVFCANDLIALGVVRAARELRVRVPEDLSIVGFDDTLPNNNECQLTTIRQPMEQMAARAAEILIERITNGNSESPPVRETPPFELIVRESTGPVPDFSEA